MTVLIVSHPVFLEHETGPGHPERPDRLRAIQEAFAQAGLTASCDAAEAPVVAREQLERVHPMAYVDGIASRAPTSGLVHLDADTVMGPHSLEAARRAAGALVLAVDRVMDGTATTAFCAVRPPGHHAEGARAMGFCFFNNVCVGAAHALDAHGLERVAIVDFDVHHGNGTEEILGREPRATLFSTFQHPLYPGTGTGSTAANVVNVPLPAGTDGAAFRQAVETHVLPALDALRPEFVFVSAGFDAHADDPLANLRLTEDDYTWVTGEVRRVATRHAQGRVVSTLEGGYNLAALGRSVVAHVEALAE